MKLKKIASLALAGIMAVSMLAGCKDGTNQEEPSSSSQVPATTNVVTYANDALSSAEKGVFTFKSSSELDTILQAAANDKTKFTSQEINASYDTAAAAWCGNGKNEDLADAVKGKVQDNAIVVGKFGCTLAANGGKDQKIVRVFTAFGALDEKTAIKQVIAEFKNGDTVINKTNYPEAIKKDANTAATYDAEYAGEISAVKVTSNDNTAKTSWVVAIVITQSVTEAANV